MPYYAGDMQRYRIRMHGRLYRGDPGLFSRFSFKKLFKAVGKVGAPVMKLAGSVAGALVPGVGTLVSKGTELLARARGAVKPALDAVQASEILRLASGAQLEAADPGVAALLGYGSPATEELLGVSGGTPGAVAAEAGGRLGRGRARKRYYPSGRSRRRRRRY